MTPFLACPACHAHPLTTAAGGLTCPSCAKHFPVNPALGVVQFLPPEETGGAKSNIQAWWGDLYRQLYEPTDRTLTRESLAAKLAETEDLFRRRDMLAVIEMPLSDLAGKDVLEIGPGGGAHSCLFAKYGAKVTAIDITPPRAASTARKLKLVGDGTGQAYQGDAENLPFQDSSFDIVYSNGVLHHSQDTERCIAEVRRVLKPGGKAVLMLYARHSAIYWCNIVPRGLFSGEMFRWPEAEWIGRVTEGTPKYGATRNPFTRVYSERELKRLLSAFKIAGLRKSSFQFDNFAIPRLTQMRAWLLQRFGHAAHPGGELVYGGPFVAETRLERVLGRYIGFAWNIVAEKTP
ncbi:MAG: methyltransferase domain-containing protein [Rhodospirillales bacterium]|nr:MAG: methyltransferase domain-containing protein [Rhodospirillales bacterium]